jgi:hypothetical protein
MATLPEEKEFLAFDVSEHSGSAWVLSINLCRWPEHARDRCGVQEPRGERVSPGGKTGTRSISANM